MLKRKHKLHTFKNVDRKNIRGMGYDGSIRIRPKGKNNKTISIHFDKKNALKLMHRLSDFVESEFDQVFITVFKEQKNDEGMNITVTSQVN